MILGHVRQEGKAATASLQLRVGGGRSCGCVSKAQSTRARAAGMASPGNSSSQAAQSSTMGGNVTGAHRLHNHKVQVTLSTHKHHKVLPHEVDESSGPKRGGKKRKLTSPVWNALKKRWIRGKLQAQCMYCKHWLSAGSNNDTKHLDTHLTACPAKSEPVGLQQQNLRLLKGDCGKVNLENTIFDQVARKDLALMICVHEYPLAMVDHDGFRKFCSTLQPLFKMVSRNTIRKDILIMYAAQKEKMVKYFANLENRVAITRLVDCRPSKERVYGSHRTLC